MINTRTLTLTFLVLTFSSVTFGFYFVVDYFMDHGWPKVFGQACEDTIQDDCAYINSHLNTFGHFDYRGHVRCKMTLDAGKQANATYKLKWHRFKLEATNCSIDEDFLEFYDTSLHNVSNATRIGRFCGWTYPDPNLTSLLTQQYMTMVFRTNGIREDKGFRFMATRILPYPCPSDDYFHCKAENKCMDGRLKCDGIEQCDDGEDESECSTWEKIIGGFLALGTAGVTAVSSTCLFLCIILLVVLRCICKRLISKPDDHVVKIDVNMPEGNNNGPPLSPGTKKVAPAPVSARTPVNEKINSGGLFSLFRLKKPNDIKAESSISDGSDLDLDSDSETTKDGAEPSTRPKSEKPVLPRPKSSASLTSWSSKDAWG